MKVFQVRVKSGGGGLKDSTNGAEQGMKVSGE